MRFDTTNPRAAEAIARLERDTVGWLTTRYPDGRLAASLVWFLLRDGELIVYSRDNQKVANIEADPNVAFNLNSDERGGSVVTIEATARVDRSLPPSDQDSAYQAKYAAGIARLGTTPAGFAADYSVPVRITPQRLRAW